MTQKPTELPNAQVLSGVTRWETEAQAAAVTSGFWGRLVTRVRSWFTVPYGYEDETGFHYGPAPTPKWAKKRNSKRNSTASPVLTDRASSVIQHTNTTAPAVIAAPEKAIAPSDSVSAV